MAYANDTPCTSGGPSSLRSLGFLLPLPRTVPVTGAVSALGLCEGASAVVLPVSHFEGPGVYWVDPGKPRFVRVTDLPGNLFCLSDDLVGGHRRVLDKDAFEEAVLGRFLTTVRGRVLRHGEDA
ncbi:hypothetical protein ACI6QG_10390 [Roseococcus sp. DSY-14]|uniref:hypothetical protein n=1 Tax=Roseococcus sp. DSY-14 TaxID=3369650 RepID=UPI00387A9B3E